MGVWLSEDFESFYLTESRNPTVYIVAGKAVNDFFSLPFLPPVHRRLSHPRLLTDLNGMANFPHIFAWISLFYLELCKITFVQLYIIFCKFSQMDRNSSLSFLLDSLKAWKKKNFFLLSASSVQSLHRFPIRTIIFFTCVQSPNQFPAFKLKF